jgi:predicted nucleic acid-binding protein
MKITFIDSGVLITAARAIGESSEKALAILEDDEREFASSEFLKLEVIPKATYNQKITEVEIYETFFDDVVYWASDLEQVMRDAYSIGCQYGLAAMDALHIAAALSVNASEFVTTEKPTKPMFRVSGIKIVSIYT